MTSDPFDLKNQASEYLRESGAVTTAVAEHCLDSILKAATIIVESFKHGGKLLLCGNGGSAADCQHMAAEFVGILRKDFKRSGLPAIALTTDTSFLTAYANDWGFDEIFERQVRTLGQSGDVLIGISTSGSSSNILAAMATAKESGIRTIALTGASGLSGTTTEVSIAVPSTSTPHIQEAHLAIEHLICELVEQQLFKGRELEARAASFAHK